MKTVDLVLALEELGIVADQGNVMFQDEDSGKMWHINDVVLQEHNPEETGHVAPTIWVRGTEY